MVWSLEIIIERDRRKEGRAGARRGGGGGGGNPRLGADVGAAIDQPHRGDLCTVSDGTIAGRCGKAMRVSVPQVLHKAAVNEKPRGK